MSTISPAVSAAQVPAAPASLVHRRVPANADAKTCQFAPIPRRQAYEGTRSGDEPVAQMERVVFTASVFNTLWRVLHWLRAAAYFYTMVNLDRLRGETANQFRAVRLRESLERLGGTFVKVGQQLSMRLDVLPPEHCRELGKMLDDVPPFPFEVAIATIERAIGGSIHETFARIDPRPIGSASIACVYQGYLHNGQKVAIKVRRPDIGRIFATDLRALRWAFRLLEWLTVLRPEFTKHLQADLSDMLMEELDLRKEARYQYLFRKMAKKAKLRYATAPVALRELSTSEVLVQEFVTGYWLSEVISAVESQDHDKLAEMREAGIRPKKVAKNLVMINHWSTQECPFFHADPHPRNILVQAHNRLVFIDFGACGAMPPRARDSTAQIFACIHRNDVTGAAFASLTALEPLPHIDVDSLVKSIEGVFKERVITLRDNKAQWWERTSAAVWMAFLEATREFNLPVNRDSLRAMRASLLYDTIAARIDPKLKAAHKLYQSYEKGRARRRGKKIARKMEKFEGKRLRFRLLEQASDGLELLSTITYRMKHLTSERPVRLASLTNKASFFFLSLIRLATSVIMLTGTIAFVVMLDRYYRGFEKLGLPQMLETMFTHPAYLVAIFLLLALKVRAIRARLNDTDRD